MSYSSSYYGASDGYYNKMNANFRNAANSKRLVWLKADDSRFALMDEVAVLAQNSDFFFSLNEAYQNYGTLSVKQEAAARNSIAQNAARKLEYAAKYAEANASSEYVGEVGDRMEFTLTVVFNKDLGARYLNALVDENGNNFAYFGGSLGPKGDVVKVRATVKRQQLYNGVKQTTISRPKIL